MLDFPTRATILIPTNITSSRWLSFTWPHAQVLKWGDEHEHQALLENKLKLWLKLVIVVLIAPDCIFGMENIVCLGLHFHSSSAADGAYCPGLSSWHKSCRKVNRVVGIYVGLSLLSWNDLLWMRDTSVAIKTIQKHESFSSNLPLTTKVSAVYNLHPGIL